MPGTGIDMLIVRENTEGLYAGRERREGDTAIAERVITRHASERIARVAFEQARQRAQSQSPSVIDNSTIHNSQFTIPLLPSSTKPTSSSSPTGCFEKRVSTSRRSTRT